MPASTTRRTDRWKSDDAAEHYVRSLLRGPYLPFENHWVYTSEHDGLEHGECLPPMPESIPGQYDRTRGIDILAVDDLRRLWVLEVSRGTVGGAARFKGGGKPVKYAGFAVQMSLDWRRAAAERFLAQKPHACEMLRDLLHEDGDTDTQVKARFRALMTNHRKAVIVPAGTHFDTAGTDVDFNTEVYTCVFPARLFRA
jgi:hypothetical protein